MQRKEQNYDCFDRRTYRRAWAWFDRPPVDTTRYPSLSALAVDVSQIIHERDQFIMHELSIAQSIAEAVQIKAEECNAAHVRHVRLRIGDATGIVTDSLVFCFEMVANSSPILEGAHLLIDRVPHRAYCRHCLREFDVTNFVARCPICQEWSAEVISGNELDILDMEIEPGMQQH